MISVDVVNYYSASSVTGAKINQSRGRKRITTPTDLNSVNQYVGPKRVKMTKK